jgi:sulfite reductase (ferredoxin)
VRISGCQNSCGQHHIGDFGFHGVAKKIDGKPAPHYQIHLGGEARLGAAADMAGMAGPIIPAGLAPLALRLLRHGYANGKRSGEKVRGWAERLGRDGIEKLLAPLAEAENGRTYLDWGDEAEFKGAPTLRGECAAPFASDDVLADFADDSLIQFDRLLAKGRGPDAEQAGMLALTYGARRVLHKHGRGTADDERPDDILAASLGVSPGSKESAALKAALGSRAKDSAQFRDAVAYYLDSVRAVVSLSEIEADAAE